MGWYQLGVARRLAGWGEEGGGRLYRRASAAGSVRRRVQLVWRDRAVLGARAVGARIKRAEREAGARSAAFNGRVRR